MKGEMLKPILVAALLAIGLSSLAGCYYYDDHDDWRGRSGYYHRSDRDYAYRRGYDRDDYAYRRGYYRDYGWRDRFDHDHDRD